MCNVINIAARNGDPPVWNESAGTLGLFERQVVCYTCV